MKFEINKLTADVSELVIADEFYSFSVLLSALDLDDLLAQAIDGAGWENSPGDAIMVLRKKSA